MGTPPTRPITPSNATVKVVVQTPADARRHRRRRTILRGATALAFAGAVAAPSPIAETTQAVVAAAQWAFF